MFDHVKNNVRLKTLDHIGYEAGIVVHAEDSEGVSERLEGVEHVPLGFPILGLEVLRIIVIKARWFAHVEQYEHLWFFGQ